MSLLFTAQTMPQVNQLLIDLDRRLSNVEGSKGTGLDHSKLTGTDDHKLFIKSDGTVPMQATLDMGGNKIINLGGTSLLNANPNRGDVVLNPDTNTLKINTNPNTGGSTLPGALTLAADTIFGNNMSVAAPATGLTPAQTRALISLSANDSPTFAGMTISKASSPNVTLLDSGAYGSEKGGAVLMQAMNSASTPAAKTFAAVNAAATSGTAAAETGDMVFSVMTGGALTEKMRLLNSGTLRITSLAGTGSRIIQVASDGSISASGIWNSSGNIGIGTASPYGNLAIGGSPDPIVNVGGSSSLGWLLQMVTSDMTDRFRIFDQTTGGAGEALTIMHGTGRVGILNNNPSNSLSVTGTIEASVNLLCNGTVCTDGAGTNQWWLGYYTAGTLPAPNGYIIVQVNGVSRALLCYS